MLRQDVPWAEAEQKLAIPDLADSTYTLTAAMADASGRAEQGDKFQFVRKHFGWEKNTLGVTEVVYPPFEPIHVDGNDVHAGD